uniref:Uncharacterized protein n=1 Tax=Cacopsylla melanoneura TaxID=428564 RepID=A0A8D8RAA3_9HEMI
MSWTLPVSIRIRYSTCSVCTATWRRSSSSRRKRVAAWFRWETHCQQTGLLPTSVRPRSPMASDWPSPTPSKCICPKYLIPMICPMGPNRSKISPAVVRTGT